MHQYVGCLVPYATDKMVEQRANRPDGVYPRHILDPTYDKDGAVGADDQAWTPEVDVVLVTIQRIVVNWMSFK